MSAETSSGLAGAGGKTAEAAGYEGLENGYLCWIDQPIDWLNVTRRFRLAGWCFSQGDEAITGLRAIVGDHRCFVSQGLPRPDVGALNAMRSGAWRSGFEVMVDVPRGASHDLRFEAGQADGSWKEVFHKRIVVSRHDDASYENWIRSYDTLRFGDRYKIRRQIHGFGLKPRFLITIEVKESDATHLREVIESVRAQLYPHWQLCLVNEAPLTKEIQRLIERDDRSRVCGNHEFPESDFILSLGCQDKLASTALYHVAQAINARPGLDLIYSDEDRLDAGGFRTEPQFKPDWNHNLLLGQNYVGQLVVFRAELLKSLGFSPRDVSQRSSEVVLGLAEETEPARIQHVPHVLYHRRVIPEERVEAKTIKRACYVLPEERPTVSIVIPTRDRLELLQPCVESILEKTSYGPFEIILIDNGSRAPEALGYLASLAGVGKVRVSRLDEEFNYSRLTNHGVQQSTAEFVLLMNNDVTVIEPRWLEEMVSYGIQRGVGAVGARLLYPDNRVQQAGVILGAGAHGVAEVAHRGIARDDPGYGGRAFLAQECSAVGAACMLVKREVYLEVGGFDEEQLKIAFNDIDFCLKVRARDYRILYVPAAELYHHEHASRGTEYTGTNEQRFAREIQFMKEKWKHALREDPAYNPNLSLGQELFTLAFPPRPWLVDT
ncbi:MAG: glycosyltransferase family 2 protein [Chthoniobacterales bacterium]